MPVPTATNDRSNRLRQRALVALLIGSAAPAMAATGIGSECDSGKDEASASAVSESPTIVATIRRTAPTEPLRLRQADNAATSDLGSLLPRSVSTSGTARELRSAALADALERRQTRRSALGGNDRTDSAGPQVEAEIPGVSEEEALVFRREMFRTDI